MGEDEFVELDEDGNPRRKTPARGRPRPQAAVRKKAPPARRPRCPAVAGRGRRSGGRLPVEPRSDELDDGAE